MLTESFFVESRARRDARCRAKDRIIDKILASIDVHAEYTAVLMPSMYGPEVAKLRARGVLYRNMFAIERDRRVHRVLTTRAEQQKGPATTKHPLGIHQAVDHIPFSSVDFAYFDFFCQPDYSHLQALIKLFRLGLCRRGTRLVTTFGTNRGDTFSCQLNGHLRCLSMGQAYIESAIKQARQKPPRKIANYRYVTAEHPANFITTEVVF